MIDRNTIRLTEGEIKLLAFMAQHWVNELPSDLPLALELSEKLRLMACAFDTH